MKECYEEIIIQIPNFKEELKEILFNLGVDAIEEQKDNIILRIEENDDIIVFAVKNFAEKLNLDIQISKETKQNINWQKQYEQSVQPLLIDDIYIHQSWNEKKDDKLNIIINPALAFGSGHHESTYGCLKLLQKYLNKNVNMLDIGCGSGILSIAGAKLGAKVSICDTDEVCLKSSISNAKINNIEFESFWLGSANLAKNKYDFVVANITADILMIISNDILKVLNENAILLLSGILDKYVEKIIQKFSDLKVVQIYKKSEWNTICLKKERNE